MRKTLSAAESSLPDLSFDMRTTSDDSSLGSAPQTPNSRRGTPHGMRPVLALLSLETRVSDGALSRLRVETARGDGLDLDCTTDAEPPVEKRRHSRKSSIARAFSRGSISAETERPTRPRSRSADGVPKALRGPVTPEDALRACIGWIAEKRAGGEAPHFFTGLSALQLGALLVHFNETRQLSSTLLQALNDEALLYPTTSLDLATHVVRANSPRLNVVAEYWWNESAHTSGPRLADLPAGQVQQCVSDLARRAESRSSPLSALEMMGRWSRVRETMRCAGIKRDTLESHQRLVVALRDSGMFSSRMEAEVAAREILFVWRMGAAVL